MEEGTEFFSRFGKVPSCLPLMLLPSGVGLNPAQHPATEHPVYPTTLIPNHNCSLRGANTITTFAAVTISYISSQC